MATARPYGLRSAAAIMLAVVRLADLASSEGRGDEARSMLRDAVAEVHELGLPTSGRRGPLVRCGGRAAGESERGVSLIAAADGHWGSVDQREATPRRMLRVRARREASLAEVRAAVPPDRFARAWAEGERMSVEQAAALILAEP